MNVWAAILLVVALLPMAGFLPMRRGIAAAGNVGGDGRSMTDARHRPPPRSPSRPGNRFRRMATGALWRCGAPVPVLLLLAGRLPALATMPREFMPLADTLGLGGGEDPWLIAGLATGAAIGMAVSAAIVAWRAWRGRGARHWFGDFAHLEATTRAERGWATVLSFAAGVTEEGYFRLLLPLLAALAFPRWGAAAGFAGSTLLFAAAHRYQGWRGVATTGVIGAAMAALYLTSGSLPLAIAYHALIDVGSLVLRPWLRQAVLRRRVAHLDVQLRSR